MKSKKSPPKKAPALAKKKPVKASSKTSVKATTKAAAKPVSKAAKPASKAAAKPAGKVPGKPAAKTKTLAKALTKTRPVARPASKPAPKPAAKPAVKAGAKAARPAPVKPSRKVPGKAVSKSVVKTVAKPAGKVAAKAAPKSNPRPVAKPVPVASHPTKDKSSPSMPPVATTVPPKAPRPSSRLAQLTVPSMAQSVASTAAKASYDPSAPSPVVVPVIPTAVKKDPKLANNWKTKPAAELTDAELIAMPDAEYMNEVQLAAFRVKLMHLKRDILSNAGETTEHLREDTSVVPDPADRATIEEEHALELRTRDRERKLLKKIEQSIARIDAGDYGYCDETGEAIGVGRLLARPTATLSLEAQQRRELKQKMFGD